MIYHLVGHEILNKTLYFVKRYYSQILRYLRKCGYVKRIQNCNALYTYIMIVI